MPQLQVGAWCLYACVPRLLSLYCFSSVIIFKQRDGWLSLQNGQARACVPYLASEVCVP